MIDVTEIDGVQIGDEVTLFGRDGDAFIPVEEIAMHPIPSIMNMCVAFHHVFRENIFKKE